MRNTIVSRFTGKFGIDYLKLRPEQQGAWRFAVYEVRTFGHTSRMPDPSFSLDEIHRAEEIMASMR
jgi:hypothetical protein